ncbi:MAG: response regulator [Chloroflexi bacterium]|nr:MAG: response regulator [Chloroflexota bacterium]
MPSRVLVADDDAPTRALIDLALQEAGYDCVLAADGKAALEQARATRPDLVVLDVGMPFLSGDDVHRELRRDRRTRYIPVVFITAKRTTAETTARFRNGADDFVSKPFDVDELVARIASALRRAAELRSLNPLSGLPGNLSIAHEIDARLADSSEAACLYVDVDHFKDFNDRHGRATGARDHRALRRDDPRALRRGGPRARLGRGAGSSGAHTTHPIRHRVDRRRATPSGSFHQRDRGRARRGRNEGGREAPIRLGLRARPPPRERD